MVGGGIINHYRKWNGKSIFEDASCSHEGVTIPVANNDIWGEGNGVSILRKIAHTICAARCASFLNQARDAVRALCNLYISGAIRAMAPHRAA